MRQLIAACLCLAGLMADAQLKLPAGFSAVTVVENFGKTRHIAVAPNGAIFVKLAKLKDGKGIYRLQDTNGDGKADKITGFGNFAGTGMAIRDGYLYASSCRDEGKKLSSSNEWPSLRASSLLEN